MIIKFVLAMEKEEKNNTKAKIISIVFLCLLIYPIIDQTFKITKRKQTNQAKKIINFPSLDTNKLESLPKLFEEFYNDKFSLQDFLVTTNSYFKIKILKVSPNPDKVTVGKKGWLFWGQYTDNFRGINLFTNDELIKLKKIIDDRGSCYKSLGIKFYFAIAPDKPSIYPEYMPSWMQKVTPFTLYDQVVTLFKNDSLVNVIDLRKPLIEAKKFNTLLYFRIDHHWNDVGAFYAYLSIINRIRKDFPLINPLKYDDFNLDTSEKITGGSEAEMLNIQKWYHDYFCKLYKKIPTKSQNGVKCNYPMPDWFPYKNDYEVVRVFDNESLPYAFVIRDSFSDYLIQYFQENFRKTKLLYDCWEYKANFDIIKKEKPDIVILIPIESNIKSILQHNN